ncbi:amidase [Microvirga antarctica]|uniref:amidase n=1 Tax=Microvirga antarctica TaxID=2819233 RepID=UPI001B307FD0|nr:amidase [Microvirga antarctica]
MHFESAVSLGARIAAGQTTSVALCQMYLDRIAAKDSLINAVVYRRSASKILADAAASDARTASGTRRSALDGVPFTLKAVLEAEETRTSTGTTAVDYYPPVGADSDIAMALKSAGAVLIGKTHAPGGPVFTETAVFGRCNNPYTAGRNPGYATGGSSGGSAAAVAAGLTGFDIGSDAAGSVRLPSSYCGVYGLKATYGTISSAGDIWPVTPDRPPVFRDLCTYGPIARSLDDIAALLPILNAASVRKPDVAPLRPFTGPQLRKVVLLDKIGVWYCDTVVQAAFNALANALRAAGVTVVQASAFPLNYNQYAGFYDALWNYPGAVLNTYYPTINVNKRSWDNTFYTGNTRPFEYHLSGMVEAAKMRSLLASVMGDADLILTPTHAVGAPVAGTTIPDTITYMCMTVLYNITGNPAVSLPLGVHSSGVPFGVRAVGRHFRDLDLIHLAKQVDRYARGFVPPSL